ncbi:hypothetical protein [Rhodococcus sp. AQ5-07]|nr:hypothetical protein [Rhodococcus sp. AQ5-07]
MDRKFTREEPDKQGALPIPAEIQKVLPSSHTEDTGAAPEPESTHG